MSQERCEVKRCKRQVFMYFYTKSVCEKHWKMHCNEGKKFDLKDKTVYQ